MKIIVPVFKIDDEIIDISIRECINEISYWASVNETEDGELLIHEIDYDKYFVVGEKEIKQAIIDIISDKELQINSSIRTGIYEAIMDINNSVLDRVDIDIIIQIAIFGKIKYS